MILISSVESETPDSSNVIGDRKFPDDFLFGAATAAFQIEGGWNASGKGPSIWDQFTHDHPELIADGQNADEGPDSYHFFEEDLKAIKSLGVRFSMATNCDHNFHKLLSIHFVLLCR